MRRLQPQFLKLLYAGLSLAFFASTCAFASPKESSAMGVADARHFLARVEFGATPEEVDAYAKLSHAQAIAQVLKPVSSSSSIPVPPDVAEYIPRSAIKEQRAQSDEARKALQREQARRALLLRTWWVDTLLQTPDPATGLRERMVLFWHNHFVSSIAKVRSTAVMQRQNQLFRERGLGSFSDLLHAVAKDPAMVVYLDSASNRKGSPNENFAREVMELFTLGEGNYSEQDIKQAARAYTGWSVDPETGLFRWRPMIHDNGEKLVLGQRGNFDGDAVLDILLAQPQCAEFIVGKLWQEFISPQPDAAEVKRIARAWTAAGRDGSVPRYDLRFVLAELFKSKAFWAAENRGSLIKSPVDLVVGTARSFSIQVDGLPFAYALQQLGQDLFSPPNVKGWPGGDAWINTNTLLARRQFVERILRSEGTRMTRRMAPEPDEDLGDMKRRMRAALESIHLDSTDWLARAQSKGLSMEQVLLAVPMDSASTDSGAMAGATPRERLRQLMLDTAYQVR